MIRVLGFLDVSKVAAAFTLKHHEHLADVFPGVRQIVLREETEDGVADSEILATWNTARAFLARLKNECSGALGGKPVELEDVRIVAVDPAAHIPWGCSNRPRDAETARILVNLIPSPAAFVHCGPSSLILWPGQVAILNQRTLNSIVNLGGQMAVYLQVDVRVLPNPLLAGPDDE